jgi:hypothetical protein
MLPCAEHSCRRFGSVAGQVILGDVAVEKSFFAIIWAFHTPFFKKRRLVFC